MLEKSANAVTFVYEPGNRGCSAVAVAGEFNGWQPADTLMTRGPDGRWRATVPLTPGEHQFKYVVDGEWLNDPAADAHAANPLGGTNSVVRVAVPAPEPATAPEPAPASVPAPTASVPAPQTPAPVAAAPAHAPPPFQRPKNTGFLNRVKRIFIRSKD